MRRWGALPRPRSSTRCTCPACHPPAPRGDGLPRRLSSAAIARREVAPRAWIAWIIGRKSAARRSARSRRTTALRTRPWVGPSGSPGCRAVPRAPRRWPGRLWCGLRSSRARARRPRQDVHGEPVRLREVEANVQTIRRRQARSEARRQRVRASASPVTAPTYRDELPRAGDPRVTAPRFESGPRHHDPSQDATVPIAWRRGRSCGDGRHRRQTRQPSSAARMAA